MKIFNYKRLYLIILSPLAFALNWLSVGFPDIVENIYSTRVYQFFGETLGRLFGIFPFSVVEGIIIFLMLFFLFIVIKIIYKVIKKDKKMKQYFFKILSTLLAFSSCIYFVFVLFCGINYSRPSYGQLTNLAIEESSLEEVKNLCVVIIKQTNSAKKDTFSKSDGTFILNTNDYYALSKQSADIINSYGKTQPLLGGYTPRNKPVFFSFIMSYFQITGIYSPFTFEANINVHSTDYNIPATMLHELAHYKGFMKESDANFIAFIVGHQSDNPDFVYSSNMLALVHSLNAYHLVATPEEYSKIYDLIAYEVKADLKENREYWQQFETPVGEFSEKVNNSYLKANGQESGTKSYGEMVDLLLTFYRQQNE